MAVFKIEIFKRAASEDWGNVWHVQATDLDEARDAASAIAAAEQVFHSEGVLFTTARVSDTLPDTDVTAQIPLNVNGLREDSGGFLPLFDTLRIDLSVAAGRPGRKYFRACIVPTDLTTAPDGINPPVVSAAASAIDSLISSLSSTTPLIQVDGDVILDAVGFPKVQMRQLHRKRRRAATTP